MELGAKGSIFFCRRRCTSLDMVDALLHLIFNGQVRPSLGWRWLARRSSHLSNITWVDLSTGKVGLKIGPWVLQMNKTLRATGMCFTSKPACCRKDGLELLEERSMQDGVGSARRGSRKQRDQYQSLTSEPQESRRHRNVNSLKSLRE